MFSGAAPYLNFKKLPTGAVSPQTNLTRMKVMISCFSLLSFIRTFITIRSITVRVNDMSEEDKRQDKCFIPWSAKIIHRYICVCIHM